MCNPLAFITVMINQVLSTLLEPPRLTIDERFRRLHGHVGGTAKIVLGFDGDPLPTITWYKDGIQLKPRSAAVGVDTTEFSSTLSVRKLTREDEGEYEVIAKNEYGVVKERFTVKVMGKSPVSTCLLVIISCFDAR